MLVEVDMGSADNGLADTRRDRFRVGNFVEVRMETFLVQVQRGEAGEHPEGFHRMETDAVDHDPEAGARDELGSGFIENLILARGEKTVQSGGVGEDADFFSELRRAADAEFQTGEHPEELLRLKVEHPHPQNVGMASRDVLKIIQKTPHF